MNKPLETMQAAALDLAMNYARKDPAHNFTKLVDWAERFDFRGEYKSKLRRSARQLLTRKTTGTSTSSNSVRK